MVILFSLCPNQVSLILATHLTWRYKGNKSESWDHFEGPYLRASDGLASHKRRRSVQKISTRECEERERGRLRCKRIGLKLIQEASNAFGVYTCPV